jgi:two-component system, NarL family, sensor histidine kinase DesK
MPWPNGRTSWLSARPVDEDPQANGQTDDSTEWPVLDAVPGGPRLARAIVLAVLTTYATLQTIDLLVSPLPSHGLQLAVDIPAISLLFLLTIWVTSAEAEDWPLWQRLTVLTAQGVITYIPVAIFGKLWGDMAGFFAGSAMLLLAGWVAWTVFAATIVSILVLSGVLASDAYDVAYLTLSTLVLGLVVFGLARLSLLIKYVHARRGELAQLAVISERMRFARDLHDLLGYSLSAITLKAEFTRRLIGTNPGRARDELAEVLDIARQALADVRIVASGYRNISLAKEASSVNSLLAAAGIDAQVDINCGMLDEKVDTVLATVLREAITNMLRHSTARHCTIEASLTGDTIHLNVANDGAARAAPSAHRGGLDNLSSRMASIGGHITTQVRDDGWFTVHAQAPLTPPQLGQDTV